MDTDRPGDTAWFFGPRMADRMDDGWTTHG